MTHGRQLATAIKYFFDFLCEYIANNPFDLHPDKYTDISVELFYQYQDYMLRNKISLLNAEKLRTAMGVVARQHGTVPLLLLQVYRRPKPKKTEPLGDDAYHMLCQALTSHIDGLYEKLEYRKTVDQAEPYTLETMEPNIPGLKVNMRGWEVDHARSLKTLLNHDFPMAMTLEQMEPMMTKNILSSYRKNNHHVVPALLHKYVYCANYNNSLNLDGLLGLYYPSDLDQCAIAIFLLLQTGWNKESVLEVDGDDFEHALSGSIDESLSVVFSEKFRSQGNEQPFDAPKQMTASSNRDDPYSIHNLVLLAKELSKPMKGYQFDADPFLANGKERNELFMFLRCWGDWFKNKSRHSSISVPNSYVHGCEAFLKQHEVHESGRRLKLASDITRRLRPTWLKHKKREYGLNIISSHFGHADARTTDIHYDSSGAAMADRMIRLRNEVEAVTALLINRKFTGLLGKRANDQAKQQVKIFAIPGHPGPLWGCENQYQPDWKGFEQSVPNGKKCYSIDKCIGCSQVRIYEDSLPYLMERLAHIEYELENESEGARSSDLRWEGKILEFLINDNHDEDTIKQASRYRRRNAPLLPRDLASLRLIFDENDDD
ncbi:hypothetical protein DM483_17885 [Pseudomonas sp. SMT-1]|nr:hypothetical protein DM483_17885 [Pseudomonas sp. SMT-1]